MSTTPPRIALTKDLSISRIVCGLWQVADIEKNGTVIDPDKGADALQAYTRDGFDTFDMADHYGSAEVITGRLMAMARRGEVVTPTCKPPAAFTKWCPEPGPMSAAIVRAGV